jgi:mono/diheme cytochrome c family protein
MVEAEGRVRGMIATIAILSCTSGPVLAQEVLDPLVAKGKLLYEETASDVGCATCHGMDATGDPYAGGVYIQGVLKSTMQSALNGGVEEMDELFDLTTSEVVAIQAYLDYLFTREASLVDPVALPGKRIFEETAGGVGCASCHLEDGTGDVGPNIQGRTAGDIIDALGRVEKMSMIELSQKEIAQVAEYLAILMEASGS